MFMDRRFYVVCVGVLLLVIAREVRHYLQRPGMSGYGTALRRHAMEEANRVTSSVFGRDLRTLSLTKSWPRMSPGN